MMGARGESEKAIVLLSGGVDSAVALYWARARGFAIHALTFDTFGRSAREIRATRDLARAASVPLDTIELPFLRELSDLPVAWPPPLSARPDPTYIPGRNLVFYSIAAARAQAMGARAIVGGHIATDPADFPDSARPFFDALQELSRRGSWGGEGLVEVLTPLAGLTKPEVVALAERLLVPLALTFSCHGTGELACGRCRACEERATAFAALGRGDPALP